MRVSVFQSKSERGGVLALVAAGIIVAGAIPTRADDRKERYCDEYVEQAVESAAGNRQNRCGFEGPRWAANADLHRFWCLAVPGDQSRRESEERRAELRQCAERSSDRGDNRERRENREYSEGRENREDREGKRADCDTYARIAVVQADANIHFHCNLRGAEWGREFDDHFRYCGHVRRETVRRELVTRAVALQKCFDGLGDFDDDKWDRR